MPVTFQVPDTSERPHGLLNRPNTPITTNTNAMVLAGPMRWTLLKRGLGLVALGCLPVHAGPVDGKPGHRTGTALFRAIASDGGLDDPAR